MRSFVPIIAGASALLAAFGHAAPKSDNALSTKCARCCSALQLAHSEQLYYPNAPDYTNSTSSYWSLQAQVNPSCILKPSSAQDVADGVKTLVKNGCPFAVRSGGHNPFPDNNIAAPGITIDLQGLNAVSLTNDTTNGLVATIGPGARWGMVYDYLTPKGVTVPGGRAATVGVGGLTLGGGNSFFAARYGFVCDNVVDFEIVLASGEIVHANQHTNSDLWTSLKGGSSSFGIVTRIELTAFEQADIWGGVVLYPSSTIPAQIDAFVKFNDAIEGDPYGSLITFWAYRSATNITVVENAYEYTKASAPPPDGIFKDLLAIKPEIPGTNTLRITNLTSLTTELEAASNMRDLFATLSFANDADIITEVYNISQRLLEPVKTAKGLNWITMFQPIPTVITKHSEERGGNIQGLDRAQGNQVLFLFFVQWEDSADDTPLQNAASDLMKEVTALTKSKGKSNEWIYLNYALQNQDPLGSYGRKNLDEMNRVSKKYDPHGVFQKLVPGGYKLDKAVADGP